MAEPAPRRPKQVVVVDVGSPMFEVHGEFFWKEDHEVFVAAARDERCHAGHNAGWVDAAPSEQHPWLSLACSGHGFMINNQRFGVRTRRAGGLL